MTAILLRRRKLGRGSCLGIQAASTKGLQVVRNDTAQWPNDLTYVFRWGCTSTIPNREGVVVVNKAEAIHWCSDKRQGRLDMQAAGVSVPKTWTAESFNEPEVSGVQYVMRPARHAQGKYLYVDTAGFMKMYLESHDGAVYRGGYISELIAKVAEYRVMVVQNRVAWVAKKTPGNPDQVAWNVAQGGKFENVRWGDWPMQVVKEALAAAKVSGCDFCGVDVMVDAEGKAFVLEVNSAPSQTSPYRQSCVAKCFDYIVEKGKEHFPDVNFSPRTTWKSTIHPALKQE